MPLHPSRTLQPVPAQPSASILRRTHQPQHQIHLKSNTKRYLNNSNNSPRAHHHRPLHRQLPRRSRQARTIHLTWPTVPSSGSKLRTLRHPRYRMPTNLLQNDLNENEGERREEDNPAALYSFFLSLNLLVRLAFIILLSLRICLSLRFALHRCTLPTLYLTRISWRRFVLSPRYLSLVLCILYSTYANK